MKCSDCMHYIVCFDNIAKASGDNVNCRFYRGYQETVTNADRIRNMTDEELAEFLKEINSCTSCRRFGNNCFPQWDVIGWLKKEYSNG